MSYEYDVPFVDFITSFGENDGADKFFDINTELEKLSIKESSVAQGKGCKENNEKFILQEVSENIQNIGTTQSQRRDLQIFSSSQSVKDVQKSGGRLNSRFVPENLKTMISEGFTEPVSASKHKKHFQTVEEINGELCIKNDDIKHTGVPRTIPNQRTKTLFQQRSFEERQKSQTKRREEKMKKVLEEEQKKRIFHANPVPNYLKLTQQKSSYSGESINPMKSTSEVKKSESLIKASFASRLPKTKSFATKSISAVKSSNNSSQNSMTNIFQARPAYVVRKQPFLPQRTECSVVKPGNVILHSEKRAKARKEFDEKLKQHYKELEAEACFQKEQLLQQEKEEIVELRKKLVHKAQPVPLFKPSSVRANYIGTRSTNCKVSNILKK